MSRKASQAGPGERKVKVRFLSFVKSGGRWYKAGEEGTISYSVSQALAAKGFIERLESKTMNAQTRGKEGSREVSGCQ
jgi:hypothetical protein